MPVRTNVYHDPNIAKGFSNLASIFAPPSGTDLYGYAKAGQTRYDMARKAAAITRIRSGQGTIADYIDAGVTDPAKSYGIADMYRLASQPGAAPDSIDARSYAVNGNANNTFEGQRRKLAVDTANNERDNANKLQVAGMTPVARDAVRYVPPAAMGALGYGQPTDGQPTDGQPSMASLFGPAPGISGGAAQPAAGMTQTGVMAVTPGERAYLPDGRVLEGTDKPQSLDQFRAQQAAAMSPDDPVRRAIIAGDVKTVDILGPDGKPQVQTVPQAIGQAPAPKQATPTELGQLQSERAALAAKDPNDPKIREYDARIAALGRGQHQSAYDEAQDKNFAKLDNDIFERAQSAAANQAQINKLGQLVQEGATDQGKWASSLVEVRKAMNALGITGSDTSPVEVMQALGNKLALELRNPTQGAGMPGSLSDSDRNFLASMVANPDHSFQANVRLLDIYSRMNQRAIDIENQRRQYVKEHGRIDEGFRDQLSDFAIKNPIFGDATPQSSPAAGAAPQQAATPAAPASAAPPQDAAAAAPKRLKYNPATGEIE